MKEAYDAGLIYLLARALVGLMQPACARISIAGSLRRKRPEVKDIEIVAQPVLVPVLNFWGDVAAHTNDLDAILGRLVVEERLYPADKRGDRYKTFYVPEIGIKLDLFVVLPPAQYGVILAIRTGPAEFSRRLVTQRKFGGLLPSHLHVDGGAIRANAGSHEIVETPEEPDVFAVLGIEWIPPEER